MLHGEELTRNDECTVVVQIDSVNVHSPKSPAEDRKDHRDQTPLDKQHRYTFLDSHSHGF